MIVKGSRWSHVSLTALAVFGVLSYYLVLALPLALLLYLNPWASSYGPWPFVAVVVFFWWTMQPSHVTPGARVLPDQAPGLFRDVEALAERMGAPRIDEIRLVDDFNAAAMEAPVRWQPWRKQRVLILGVPLLALTDVDTVRCVIAHELAHFSRRHGRLSQWIYRARAGWLSYADEPLAEVTFLERGAAYFARWFAPRYSKLSFDHSRRCEYEADALGASIVGRVPMAAGLLTLAVLGRRWAEMSQQALPRLMAEQDAPPAAWLSQVQQQVLTQAPQAPEFEALKHEVAALNDTHPTTAERLQALQVRGDEAIAACALPTMLAGQTWLPDWPAVMARFHEGWCQRHARTWRQEHVRQRVQRERLALLRSQASTSLERAALELEHGDAAVAADMARHSAVAATDAASRGEAEFLLGAAQLQLKDPQGIATLEAAIKSNPLWAFTARSLIDQHARQMLDAAAQRRNAVLLKRAADKRGRALAQVFEDLHPGRLAPASLDESARTILREVYAGMPVVAAAWCLARDEVVHDGRAYRAMVLVLRLRTQALQAAGLSEEEVRDEAQALLAGVLPGAVLRLVWTVYTTEALPPGLDAQLEGWAQSGHPCCLVPPTPGESVGPGVRAAALR